MSASDIHAWLQLQENYQVGLDLLKENCSIEDGDLFLLDLGETSVSRQLLVTLLKRHVDQVTRETAQLRQVSKPLVTKAEIHAEQQELARDPNVDGYKELELPPVLQDLRESIKPKFKEMDFLRSRLELLPTDEDRLRDALRIRTLDREIASAYSQLDAWKATGRVPVPAEHVKRNGADLKKQLQNIKTYLSRHRTGKRVASPARVAQWEKQETELQDLIDAL